MSVLLRSLNSFLFIDVISWWITWWIISLRNINLFEELMNEHRNFQKRWLKASLETYSKVDCLSGDTKATDLDRSSMVEVTVPADISDKGLSPTLAVEADKGLTEAIPSPMADTLATNSVLPASVQSWLSQRSIP